MTPPENERLVAEGERNWWDSPEGIERLGQIEAEVRERHAADLERAGWLRKHLLELRIRREIAAERDKATLEILWLER